MSRTAISRAVFLQGINERPKEDVPLPELGEGLVILVVGMTAKERTAFERQFATKDGKTIDARMSEFRERLVVACCRNDDGSPLFQSEDVIALGGKRADVLERIVNVCQRLSGFSKEDIEATVGN